MFPYNQELQNDYPLQSKIFGHRFKQSQSVYEYLLEFLLVLFSEKNLGYDRENGIYKRELFPDIIDGRTPINYKPNNNVGLKRFIFFPNSKQESQFEIDKDAYNRHLADMKEKIEIDSYDSMITKEYSIQLLQNLLYGFSAVVENRSWFAQSFLPICKSAVTTEIMGVKTKRNKVYKEILSNNKKYYEYVDKIFETNRYNFMCRGGEVYYLHILRGIINYPKFKEKIESGFNKLINQFKELEKLCSEIQKNWVNSEEIREDSFEVRKTLGTIPDGFSLREEYTLAELSSLLHSDMHPFEKVQVLSNGIILQIIIMCYLQARNISGKDKGYLIFDVNCYKGNSDEEIKKIANSSYRDYEQDIFDALYCTVEGNIKDNKDEKETISDAINDSVKVYKKIGKQIGIIRPMNDKFIRFTLNEKVLKYLVLSLVKPDTKMTLDRFMNKLFEHYRIVIGPEEFSKFCKNDNKYNKLDIIFFEKNKRDFQIMMKECGFLRELSDSTSIVENPYKED